MSWWAIKSPNEVQAKDIHFRLSHIGDCLAIYKAIKADHEDLSVELVSTGVFAGVGTLHTGIPQFYGHLPHGK